MKRWGGGFPDGTFQPNGDVTRAQFVKLLVLTLGLKPSGAPTPFSGVPASAWYAPYVSAAVRAGIVDGVSPTLFDPDGTLTREQMAVLLARALDLTQTATLRFTDDGTIAAWALQGVEEAIAAGYVDGFPNGSFQPLGAATRAQAAKVPAMVLSGLATSAPGGARRAQAQRSGADRYRAQQGRRTRHGFGALAGPYRDR